MNKRLLLVGLVCGMGLVVAGCRSEDTPVQDLSIPTDLSTPRDLIGADLTQVDLAGADLTQIDLANADMSTALFAPLVSYAAELGPIYIASADLNKDGKRDLIVVNTNDPDGTITGTVKPASVNVFLGNGDGTFQAKISKPVNGFPFGIAIADLNADTNSDVVVGEGDGFEYFPGSATGALGTATKTTYAQFGRSIAIGDIDGDGKADVVQSDLGNDVGKVWVARGDGAGHFTVPTTSFVVSTVIDPDTVRQPVALRLGDMNNDGKPDVVTANVTVNSPTTNAVSILLNTSVSGTVALSATPIEITSGKRPQDLLLSQLDATNKLDIVVSNGDDNQVAVYLSDVAGAAVTFTAPVAYTVGLGPNAVAFADIDSDTKVDLVTADGIGNTVTVLYGGGAGVFGQSTPTRPGKESYPVGTNPVAIVVGTFNSDVKIDIATANQVSNNVSVLINSR